MAIRFLDMASRKVLPFELPKDHYFDVVFSHEQNAVFYSKHTPQGPRVFRHEIGSGTSSDELIFGEQYGLQHLIGVTDSEDGRYLLYEVYYGSSSDQTDIYIQKVDAGSPIVTVVKDVPSRFHPRFGGHRLYIHTNENAPRNRIMAVSVDDLSRDKWVEVVPESSAVLQDFTVIGGHILGLYLENVHSSVRVFREDGKRLPDLPTPSIGTVAALEGTWSSPEAFLQFTSFNIPTTVYRFDIRNPELSVFHRLDVPFNGENLDVKQVWVESKDKTRVPMFLVHQKNLQLDGFEPGNSDRIRRIQSEHAPGIFRACSLLGGTGRCVCVAGAPGRRRVGRAVASGRNEREEAERF